MLQTISMNQWKNRLRAKKKREVGAVQLMLIKAFIGRPNGDMPWKLEGATRDKGATGNKGATGDKGTKGATGDKSAPGAPGAIDATGATRAAGATGATGAVGDKGASGTNGNRYRYIFVDAPA